MKVGLEAGRYSGTNLPDLYLTPHALHSVFGPKGPVRHCGVLSEAQCRHFRPGVSTLSRFFDGALVDLAVGVVRVVLLAETLLLSDDDVAGDKSSWRREDQSQGAARERLLRAFPGTEVSAGKAGGELAPVEIVVAEEELSVVLMPEAMFAKGMN